MNSSLFALAEHLLVVLALVLIVIGIPMLAWVLHGSPVAASGFDVDAFIRDNVTHRPLADIQDKFIYEYYGLDPHRATNDRPETLRVSPPPVRWEWTPEGTVPFVMPDPC
jgi:hypothetical protein